MTLTLFNKTYDNYKNLFDLELMLRKTGTTYKDALAKARKEEEGLWF